MNPLRAALLSALLASPGAAFAVEPALYSFNDIYRMTVSSAPADAQALPAEAAYGAALRVSVIEAAPAEIQFRVTPVRQPQTWLLLLSGLALAGWVAHRRLVNWG